MRLTWLTLMLPLCAQADVKVDALVRVRPRISRAAGREVRLIDLCEVEDPALAEALKAIVVATSPAKLGTPELINLFRPVIDRARAGGANVRLNLPKSVEILAGRDLAPAAVSEELIARWQPACADCRLEIEGLNLPQVPDVRDWSIKGKPELPRGSFSVALELIRAKGAPLVAWVSGRLAQKRRVAVAHRLIQMGERIERADFTFEDRDVAQAFDGLPAEDEIAGRRARRGLRVGEIMYLGTLERERAIHRGDAVRVHLAEAGWDVAITATSPQDAFVGDVVSFKNTKTGNVVVGSVTGPGEAVLR